MRRDYKTPPDSIWKAIARLRWPDYEITGAGALAVLHECSRKVILCSLPMEAQQIAAECCGATCNLGDRFHQWHQLVELDRPKPRHFDVGRSRAMLERHK